MRLLPRSSCGPEACALFAALLNGTIGVLTRVGFDQGATPALIAFWKCFGAFLLVCTLCACRPQLRTQTVRLTRRWPQFACLSLLGIFGLYYFETKAFAQASIPLVSFLTYAAGGATIALSGLFLGEKVTRQKLLAFAAIVAGVGLMSLFEHGIAGSLSGIVLALMGGCGYALFIFLSKGFRIGSGLPQLVWLFGFGSLFLLMPLVSEGFAFPAGAMWATLCALVSLPTIGGFYFTTRAVERGQASKVQIIETSDPLFATGFAFLLFGDRLSVAGLLGAGLIAVGLLIAVWHRPAPDLMRATAE
ncbi:DMT family transporter [Pandoraea apista]|uniref:DMT family transporter n=1 Tax=Pandoraea apista TaxID=93218 RepID=UPI00058A8F26|nr:DMT family transporter [Pandoraea apista]AJE98349.1 membrane protein [Pandoraea apista]AKH72402.1 membrane protein [Pandoraea apista]AKI60792.1 membrane protein [Pandoraea apista]